MNGYMLSTTGTTEHPWYVTSVSCNLYSVEELLYFMYKNPALIDAEMESHTLTRWLAGEFGLGEAANEMDRALRANTGLKGFVIPLFREMGYLDRREMTSYMRTLDILETGSVPLRLKMKADALTRNRRYGEAVAIYHQAEENLDRSEKALLASIYTNRGAALMQLLEYDEAAADYERAYRVSGSRKALENLLLALRVARPREQYELRVSELRADPQILEKTERRVHELETAEIPLPDDPEAELMRIRKVYHQEAGV